MNQPQYVAISSTGSQMEIILDGLTTYKETGGATVDSYLVQYRVKGTTSWTDAKGQDGAHDTALSASISGLSLGVIYEV